MANHEMEGGIKIYLREIGKTDLLTPQQEVELADRIKKGDPEARAHMIKANLRLVVKIAQDYANYGLPLLDLISEGNIGLTKAVERFDPNKGGKVSTYAAWWIKQSIKRALANQSKTIRLPVHMVDKITKMNRVAMAMSEELGREPTTDELSDEIGIDRGKLSQLKTASMRPASLDAPMSDDDSTEFGEIVGDENAVGADEALAHKEEIEQVHDEELLGVLNEREKEILSMRFGTPPYKKKYTLDEVKVRFGVTRQRISQLETEALRKLTRAFKNRNSEAGKIQEDAKKRTLGASSGEDSMLLFHKNTPKISQKSAGILLPSDPKTPADASIFRIHLSNDLYTPNRRGEIRKLLEQPEAVVVSALRNIFVTGASCREGKGFRPVTWYEGINFLASHRFSEGGTKQVMGEHVRRILCGLLGIPYESLIQTNKAQHRSTASKKTLPGTSIQGDTNIENISLAGADLPTIAAVPAPIASESSPDAPIALEITSVEDIAGGASQSISSASQLDLLRLDPIAQVLGTYNRTLLMIIGMMIRRGDFPSIKQVKPHIAGLLGWTDDPPANSEGNIPSLDPLLENEKDHLFDLLSLGPVAQMLGTYNRTLLTMVRRGVFPFPKQPTKILISGLLGWNGDTATEELPTPGNASGDLSLSSPLPSGSGNTYSGESRLHFTSPRQLSPRRRRTMGHLKRVQLNEQSGLPIRPRGLKNPMSKKEQAVKKAPFLGGSFQNIDAEELEDSRVVDARIRAAKLKEYMTLVLPHLEQREADVLIYFFGLMGKPALTQRSLEKRLYLRKGKAISFKDFALRKAESCLTGRLSAERFITLLPSFVLDMEEYLYFWSILEQDFKNRGGDIVSWLGAVKSEDDLLRTLQETVIRDVCFRGVVPHQKELREADWYRLLECMAPAGAGVGYDEIDDDHIIGIFKMMMRGKGLRNVPYFHHH